MNNEHLPVSPREREIAELIAQGLTNREIADRLTISIRTVESHIYNARIKLDARNRHELARAVWGERPRERKTSRCLACPYYSQHEEEAL